MKKSNNSNPLKYFNDAAASRKKSVIAGNNKLVKAQAGYTKLQGPITKNTSFQIDQINRPITVGLPSNLGRGREKSSFKFPTKQEKETNDQTIKNMVDFERGNTNFIPETYYFPSEKFIKGDYKKHYEDENKLKKTGGAVKSKKK